MKFGLLLLINILIAINLSAETKIKDDFTDSLKYMGKASYLQFSETPSLYYLGIGTGTVLWANHNDTKIVNSVSKNKSNKVVTFLGNDLAILGNSPILPLSFYFYGTTSENSKIVNFSKEYFSALYLTLAETVLLSQFNFHPRPETSHLTMWETSFRGNSSFPSGHVAGLSVLTFKTFQFYGPLYAIAPLSLTLISSFERVNTKKHYPSDVAAAIFLSAMSSEGVRIAAQNTKDNDTIYEKFLEKTHFQIFAFNNQYLMQVAWDFQ